MSTAEPPVPATTAGIIASRTRSPGHHSTIGAPSTTLAWAMKEAGAPTTRPQLAKMLRNELERLRASRRPDSINKEWIEMHLALDFIRMLIEQTTMPAVIIWQLTICLLDPDQQDDDRVLDTSWIQFMNTIHTHGFASRQGIGHVREMIRFADVETSLVESARLLASIAERFMRHDHKDGVAMFTKALRAMLMHDTYSMATVLGESPLIRGEYPEIGQLIRAGEVLRRNAECTDGEFTEKDAQGSFGYQDH